MKFNRILAVCLLASALIITACKKDDDGDNNGNNTPEIGTLKIEIEHEFNGTHFHLHSAFTSAHGDELTFSAFKYYISNLVLINSKNEEYTVPNSYYLINADDHSSTITLKDIPKGDYKSFKFIIGVDSTRNVSGDQVGALDPINGMFWSWNTGYRFVLIEGTSPQSPTNTFIYHVGGFKTNANAIRTVSLTSADNAAYVKPGATPEVHLMVNVAEVFTNPENIDVSTLNDIHMPGANAVKMADSYADMFSLDHIHN